jgi:signal peptidase I/conjugal transfer pilin signal peptidase TrbI
MTSDRKLFIVKISILAGTLLIGIIMATIVTSSDVSLPYSLWMRKIINTGFERDEYVLIRYNQIKLVKQIKCVPGDWLEKVNDCFYCNTEQLCCTKPFDRQGKPTKIFQYSGSIPDFHYFVMGEHKDSFDSRYIGLINTGQIEDALWAIK